MAANTEDCMDTEEGIPRLDVAQKRRLEEDLKLPPTSGSEGEPDGEEWTETKARKRAKKKISNYRQRLVRRENQTEKNGPRQKRVNALI
ncbi:hypothetical protein QE152_g36498 [Popillia japonica]|uniref:Uncharacterized protein n=1 Tax=Popillia japonica TaxID=7064 RepID=A0AAW1IDH7_POPJA